MRKHGTGPFKCQLRIRQGNSKQFIDFYVPDTPYYPLGEFKPNQTASDDLNVNFKTHIQTLNEKF